MTQDVTPSITAASLTAILQSPIESLTVAQFRTLANALKHVSGGNDNTKLIGTLLV